MVLLRGAAIICCASAESVTATRATATTASQASSLRCLMATEPAAPIEPPVAGGRGDRELIVRREARCNQQMGRGLHRLLECRLSLARLPELRNAWSSLNVATRGGLPCGAVRCGSGGGPCKPRPPAAGGRQSMPTTRQRLFAHRSGEGEAPAHPRRCARCETGGSARTPSRRPMLMPDDRRWRNWGQRTSVGCYERRRHVAPPAAARYPLKHCNGAAS